MMLMLRLLLSSAVPLLSSAFTVPHHIIGYDSKTTTSLDAVSRLDFLQMVLVAPLAPAVASASSLDSPSIDSSGMLLSVGAYQSEAGYDDFSNGLSMPKYNVDNEGQLGLTTAQEKEIDPKKLERMQAKAAAAKEAAAKKAADAQAKKAAAQAAAEKKLEANAAKIQEKEEAKKRQLANMSEKQRAKMEAYEAKKAADKDKPSVTDNMKRMYGIK